MERFMFGPAMALVVMVCIIRPSTVRAQDDGLMDRKISLRADHERLDDVLKDLAKKGYVTFSYKSDILDKDRLVTLTIRESTLREALGEVLGKEYALDGAGDYVIIRLRDDVKSKKVLRKGIADKSWAGEKSWPDNPTPMMKMKEKAEMAKGVKRFGSDSVSIAVLRQRVRNIIADMAADGIVKDWNITWFALDSGQFIVDGNRVADSLHTKYVAKYIGPDGAGYYYGNLHGVTGRGYFFDKQEIFGKQE